MPLPTPAQHGLSARPSRCRSPHAIYERYYPKTPSHLLAIAAKHCRPDWSSMALQGSDLLAALRIPDDPEAVVAGGYDSLAIAAESRCAHGGKAMPPQNGDLFAVLRIPNTRGTIARRRHHVLPITAERCSPYRSIMAFQGYALLAALRIPNASDAIASRCHYALAIITERRRRHVAGVAL